MVAVAFEHFGDKRRPGRRSTWIPHERVGDVGFNGAKAKVKPKRRWLPATAAGDGGEGLLQDVDGISHGELACAKRSRDDRAKIRLR